MKRITKNPRGVRRWLCAICLWLSCAACVAQDIAEHLTLEDAIAIALANNYDIMLSRSDSTAAALDYGYRDMVFYPRINATAGTNWLKNSQRQEYATGTERSGNVSSNNLNASVSLDWTLFDGMRMFVTREKAEQHILLGELVIKEQIVNTVADVITTYYNIVRQKQQLRAVEEQMAISEITRDLAQRKLEIGVGARPEVLQSQVDLNARKAARLQQQMLIRQMKETLVTLIRPSRVLESAPPADFEVSDTIPVDLSLNVDAVLQAVWENNPSLALAEKEIDIAHLSVAELKADRLPTVDFNAAYNFSRTNNNLAVNPVLPVFNRNRGFNYGFTVSMPILNYRNTRRLIEQAELDLGFRRIALENQQALLRLGVINAFREFEFQQEALGLEESNILLARENVDIMLETYRLGNATYLQLREAQKSLEDAYNRLIAARYAAKVGETELLRLQGNLVR